MLSIEHLTASIEKKRILDDISYSFDPGKTYAILGPNGSGKSTLASIIMGHPDFTLTRASKLLWNGKSLKNLSPDKRAQLGLSMTFQNQEFPSAIFFARPSKRNMMSSHSTKKSRWRRNPSISRMSFFLVR
jgi:Fe-S cluster assembly ATPase SufC